jgi:hypothetical protein
MILIFFLIEVSFSLFLENKDDDNVLLKSAKWSPADFLDVLFFKDNADCNWLTSFMCDK